MILVDGYTLIATVLKWSKGWNRNFLFPAAVCVSHSGIKARFIPINVDLSIITKDMSGDFNMTSVEMSHCVLFVQCMVWISQMCRYYTANVQMNNDFSFLLDFKYFIFWFMITILSAL